MAFGPAEPSVAALELRGVCKNYGGSPVVIDVDLTVGQGEFVSILGPSGCGKTTLLRIIAGFVRPSTGMVSILGKRADNTPPHLRPTNMVFQHLALFPHLTVYANVAFPLVIRKRNKREIDRAVRESLEQVGLVDMDRRMPSELSGGQQQRVAIARALVNRPAALLLDEPLGSLDLKRRRQMQLELKTLNRHSGTTFVYVTHDQEEAMAMSDRIAVMQAGRIEQIGTAEEI